MLNNKKNGFFSWRSLGEFTLLVGLAFFVHFIVLRLVFPGYYSPLWPNHDDFYMPLGVALAHLPLLDYFKYPRPVGMVFFDAIGHLGIHGSIFAVLSLIMLNCAFTAIFFSRVAGIEVRWPFLLAFCVYVFLVFAHPFFYVFSIHDAFSQLSYTLLIVASWCFFRYDAAPRLALLIAFIALSLLGFLSKETYGLCALFLASAWFLFRRSAGVLRASAPAIVFGATLVAALLINFINKSPFTSGATQDSAAYHVAVMPLSLITEWSRYAANGINLLAICSLLLIAIAAFLFAPRISRWRWMALLLPTTATLAWLPNAALPNHYFPGYSWNGTYLLFAPVLLIVPLWRLGRPSRVFCTLIIGTALCSPLLSSCAYKSNAWTLGQESIQRNLLKALGNLTQTLPTNGSVRKLLVTGINFPFSPFNQAFAMRMFPNTRKMQFDVVDYQPRLRSVNSSGVRFISPSQVDISNYQRVWAFLPDGKLAKDFQDPTRFSADIDNDYGFGAKELLIYPKLLEILDYTSNENIKSAKPDGNQYLNCGTTLLSYGNIVGAEKCLISSTRLIPKSPYPYFFLGKIQERQGLTELARASFERAVALDNPKSPNPYFREALKLISKPATEPTK